MKITPSVGGVCESPWSIAVVTYKYTRSGTTNHATTIKNWCAQDLINTDGVLSSSSFGLNLPGDGGGLPRSGYLRMDNNVQETNGGANAFAPDVAGTELISVAIEGGKETMWARVYGDLLKEATSSNINDSKVYKGTTDQTPSTISLVMAMTFTDKIGDIAGITKDNDGVALVSCEVHLFKVTGSAPKTHEFLSKQTSNGTTGAYSFPIFETVSPGHRVVAQKDDTPHVFDCTDDVLQEA